MSRYIIALLFFLIGCGGSSQNIANRISDSARTYSFETVNNITILRSTKNSRVIYSTKRFNISKGTSVQFYKYSINNIPQPQGINGGYVFASFATNRDVFNKVLLLGNNFYILTNTFKFGNRHLATIPKSTIEELLSNIGNNRIVGFLGNRAGNVLFVLSGDILVDLRNLVEL